MTIKGGTINKLTLSLPEIRPDPEEARDELDLSNLENIPGGDDCPLEILRGSDWSDFSNPLDKVGLLKTLSEPARASSSEPMFW